MLFVVFRLGFPNVLYVASHIYLPSLCWVFIESVLFYFTFGWSWFTPFSPSHPPRFICLFSGNNHRFSLRNSPHLALPRMPSPVLLLSLNASLLDFLDLSRFLYGFRDMSVFCYPTNLGHVFVSFFKSVIIFEFCAFAGRAYVGALGGLRAPEADVPIVRPRKNIASVSCEGNREYALHSFCMIYVPSRVVLVSLCALEKEKKKIIPNDT